MGIASRRGVSDSGRSHGSRTMVQVATRPTESQAVNLGEVAEWLKALVSKTSIGVSLSRVRIPPSPLDKSSTTSRLEKSGQVIFKVATLDASVSVWRCRIPAPSLSQEFH